MKKVLITGGAGFIGSNLADKLAILGYKVVVVDNLSTGKRKNLNKNVSFYKTDIKSKKLCQVFNKEKPDFVFHLAAQKSVSKSFEFPADDASENILGFINILQNCRKSKIRKLIFASSGGAVYDFSKKPPFSEKSHEAPLSPYGASKLSAEKYLQLYSYNFNIPFAILRFSNVYGPRQSPDGEAGVIAIFLEKIFSKNKYLDIFGTGLQTRDFVFVDDAVSALIKAMRPYANGIFNIGTGRETSINELAKIVKLISKSTIRERHISKKTAEQARSCLNWSKAKKDLGWHPEISLKEGILQTINWFKEK